MAATKIMLNGTSFDMGGGNVKIEEPTIYQGRELSEFTWSQLSDKCKIGDFSDLRVGDYKTDGVGATATKMSTKFRILGIDLFYNTRPGSAYPLAPHHIDFFGDKCLTNGKWTNNSNNNGVSDTSQSPYTQGEMLNTFSTVIFNALPSELQNIITNKYGIIEGRYSSSGIVSSATSSRGMDLYKIWTLFEEEIFGERIFEGNSSASSFFIQYPFFTPLSYDKLLLRNNTNSLVRWWLGSVPDGDAYSACLIDTLGMPNTEKITDGKVSFPICFRIS